MMRTAFFAITIILCQLYFAVHTDAFKSVKPAVIFGRPSRRFEEVSDGHPSPVQPPPSGSGMWKVIKRNAPALVTGAWEATDGDKNPAGAVYNMVFIRIPVIFAGGWYTSFVLQGQPLLLDFGFGSGPTEIFPIIPYFIFGLMLL